MCLFLTEYISFSSSLGLRTRGWNVFRPNVVFFFYFFFFCKGCFSSGHRRSWLSTDSFFFSLLKNLWELWFLVDFSGLKFSFHSLRLVANQSSRSQFSLLFLILTYICWVDWCHSQEHLSESERNKQARNLNSVRCYWLHSLYIPKEVVKKKVCFYLVICEDWSGLGQKLFSIYSHTVHTHFIT